MRVTARRQGEEGFAHEVETEDGHRFTIDEPISAGGEDLGPRPTALLASSLAGCTAITLELYAARKGWDLGEVEVDVDVDLGQPAFDVTVRLSGELDEEQRARLLKIASKCPVHKVLAAETSVKVSDRIESA
ncbi:MAG TPA: OsmC family protein [Solirubrobacterales bacterium]|nr:OsmC family protein [Solirubrobacterales bacterium]